MNVIRNVICTRGNIYQSDGERAPNKEKPAALFAKGSVGITDSNKAGASLLINDEQAGGYYSTL
ncbi:hypothetical protein ACYCT4_004724, partial [Escherichia coli]